MLKLRKRISTIIFKLQNLGKEKFECPVCGYVGHFMGINPPTGFRKHALCPKCGSLERHRMQYLVVNTVLKGMDISKMKMLHFAPEPFFREFFSKLFDRYETADLDMKNVDHKVDLQELPFGDSTYDFIFASHVLEHIPNDMKAIGEIRRVLKQNGIAILPVPLTSEKTIEYPSPNPNEAYHVRSTGMDYFDRFKQHFTRVEKFSPDLLPEKYQLFTYEDRSKWPTEKYPFLQAMQGEKHIEIVPVCYV